MNIPKKIFPLFLIFIFIAIMVSFAMWKRRPYLTVIGHVKMADGLGRQSVELINTFANDISIGFIPTHPSIYTDVPSKVLPLLKRPNKKLGKVVLYESPLPKPNVEIFAHLEKTLKRVKNKKEIRIAYSMLESSLIPPLWASALNAYFDAVVVPDEFLISAYQLSGVQIPIFVLPLGLEIDPFLKMPLKTSRNKPFRFINLSSLIPRKNHDTLIKAFHTAFGNNPDVQLYMNYRYATGDLPLQITSLIESLGATNIFLKNEPLDNEKYRELFSTSDAIVSFAKGEGFSIQPREAMALGLPVIISNNTAHQTIVKTGLACAIPCPTFEPAFNEGTQCYCGVEYIPDFEESIASLRDVYENYEGYLEKAQERRKWAANYSYENLKPLYATLIKPKKVILADRNEIKEDVLITTSRKLYKKYQRLMKSY